MASDPTSVLFEAVRAYLAAVDPHFALEWVKLVGRDGNKIKLRFRQNYAAAPADRPFVPTPFQEEILAALEGKALRTDALGHAVGDRSRLFRKPGGIAELREHGLVNHHARLGYYRPDAPPEELG